MKLRMLVIFILIAVIAAALAITQPWLYFVNREVNEAFPRTDGRPARSGRGYAGRRETSVNRHGEGKPRHG